MNSTPKQSDWMLLSGTPPSCSAQNGGGDGDDLAESEGAVGLDEALRPPGKFGVFLMNDDYTTMEFVMEVLQKFFNLPEDKAYAVMLLVHRQGKGLAGVYPLEIAETKVHQVHEAARSKKFPLRCVIEEILDE